MFVLVKVVTKGKIVFLATTKNVKIHTKTQKKIANPIFIFVSIPNFLYQLLLSASRFPAKSGVFWSIYISSSLVPPQGYMDKYVNNPPCARGSDKSIFKLILFFSTLIYRVHKFVSEQIYWRQQPKMLGFQHRHKNNKCQKSWQNICT